MEEATVEKPRRVITPPEGYTTEPQEKVEGGFPYVDFGNTGLRLDFYEDAWALTFQSPRGNNPRERRTIYTSGLLFILGLYESVEWFEKIGRFRDEEGFVRNDTNARMHNFRLKLFDELTKESGVDGIYKETGKFLQNYEYELRYDRLTKAIRTIEEEQSPEERGKIRFFKRLEEARAYWAKDSKTKMVPK